MPRIRHGLEQTDPLRHPDLRDRLVDELRSERAAGQPRIDERHFPGSNAIRVIVIWDEWDPVPDDERTEIILQAYEQVEGKDFRDRISVAVGLTTFEAADFGMLPYQVELALRNGDPVRPEQCREAMIEQGASVLRGRDRLQLRFATLEEAEDCIRRLVERLPASKQVWIIRQELSHVDI